VTLDAPLHRAPLLLRCGGGIVLDIGAHVVVVLARLV
jgi:hypothetical protein